MICVICKHGKTINGTVTITLERGDTMFVFKHVPAQVCENCGEAYVDEATTALILQNAEKALETGIQVEIREFQVA